MRTHIHKHNGDMDRSFVCDLPRFVCAADCKICYGYRWNEYAWLHPTLSVTSETQDHPITWIFIIKSIIFNIPFFINYVLRVLCHILGTNKFWALFRANFTWSKSLIVHCIFLQMNVMRFKRRRSPNGSTNTWKRYVHAKYLTHLSCITFPCSFQPGLVRRSPLSFDHIDLTMTIILVFFS